MGMCVADNLIGGMIEAVFTQECGGGVHVPGM